MDFQLDYASGIPVYRQIMDAVVRGIAGGQLGREGQLPTIHELARKLEINPNTVARAYRDLEAGGYVVAMRGRGTFPANRPAPSEEQKEAGLKSICQKAMADGALQGLTVEEIGAYLRRMA